MPEPDQAVITALYRDPPVDTGSPAETLPQAVRSRGDNLNAVLYTASGAGPHPTMLLLHGFRETSRTSTLRRRCGVRDGTS